MERNFRAKEDTRTSSPTIDSKSSDFSLPHNQIKGSVSSADWTDKKHNMYLKSMETSFVDQLYDSKEMFTCLSPVTKTSSDATTASGQFKVLRGGNWQKITFVKENPQTRRLNECHDLKANPWIQHYQYSGRQGSLAAPMVEDIVTSTTTSQAVELGQRIRFPSLSAEQLHFCESHMFSQQDLVCSDTEMSDQNFTDEEVEGEKEDNERNVKRLKTPPFFRAPPLNCIAHHCRAPWQSTLFSFSWPPSSTIVRCDASVFSVVHYGKLRYLRLLRSCTTTSCNVPTALSRLDAATRNTHHNTSSLSRCLAAAACNLRRSSAPFSFSVQDRPGWWNEEATNKDLAGC
ncbi:hypothetical protein SESBI_31823 [Sesbania bispinosa]|nr:hypothetical protein SESBI_31823 [Sesbania bispinosa]